MDHQSQIPGKSVTDLLTQVILRVAGPDPNSYDARGDLQDDPHEDGEIEDDEGMYEWVEEEGPELPEDTAIEDGAAPEIDDDEVDDTGRGRRRNDNDLFRI